MSYNRFHNVANPNQGTAKRVLCLCSAGLLRSPTIANVLHKMYGYNTRAAGVHTEYALIPVDPVLIAWADQIVCAEDRILKHVVANFELHEDQEIVHLSIPDKYAYMDEELQNLIVERYLEVTNV